MHNTEHASPLKALADCRRVLAIDPAPAPGRS
jgi:hypothetical protein